MRPAQPKTQRPDRFGERCLSALFMIFFGVVYLNSGTDTWAKVVSWVAVVAGLVLAIYFGTRFVQQHRSHNH